jgi:hypothetical protein
METIKANLDGTRTQLVRPQTEIQSDSLYLVDFAKISSVNDLVLIFAAMGISFSTHHPHFDAVKQFLNLDNPIPINPTQQPQATNIKLPKLKPVK